LFESTFFDEKTITNKHDIKIKNIACNFLSTDLFSIINLNITATTNNPAIACNADRTRPAIKSKIKYILLLFDCVIRYKDENRRDQENTNP
jgi:hypothetical protein